MQSGRTRHTRGRSCRQSVRSEAARDFQQMRSVIGREHARLQNALVARPLLLFAELFRREPNKGVEPIESAGQLSQCSDQNVAPFDMYEFVQEDNTSSIGAPPFGFG